jgi:hypothetical protein
VSSKQLYKQRFAEVVVDTKDGVVAAGKTVEDVQKMKSAEDKKRYRVVVLSKTDGRQAR